MRKAYIIFSVLIAVTLLAAVWNIPFATVKETLPMVINVTDVGSRQLDFSVSADAQKKMDFGATFPGTMVIKTMNLTRGEQPPAYVSISTDGTIGPWVELSNREFLLKEPVQVSVSVKVPEKAKTGRYTGNLTIVYKKTLFSVFLT